MLTVTVPSIDHLWDEEKEVFVTVPETTFEIEHNLLSIKKWESKWHKPYLSKVDKTSEEVIDYIRCMTLTENVDPNVYYYLSRKNIEEIISYINDPMTATWFSNQETVGAQKKSNEVITNEIIYYWMITLGIPMECQTWHLEQLLTLIKVVNVKNEPKRKMDQREMIAQQKALNKARRAKLHSNG